MTLRLSYHAEGGLLGVITDRVAAPIVGGNLKRSLAELKRTLERQGASHRRALVPRRSPRYVKLAGMRWVLAAPRRAGHRGRRDAADHPAHGGEPDVEDRLTKDGGTAEVNIEAVPAVRLLFDDGDKLEVKAQGGRHPDR